jgi:kynureninase
MKTQVTDARPGRDTHAAQTAVAPSPVGLGGTITREQCANLDAADPLAFARQRFHLPEGVIYLDGNSLGAQPVDTVSAMQRAMVDGWGEQLIRAWNSHDWVNLPTRVGAELAPLIGADADEVIIADSTSVNLFKLLAGAVSLPEVVADSKRRVILSEEDNFPTDLYVAQGLSSLLDGKVSLRTVPRANLLEAIDDSVAVIMVTHVDYRTGHMLDMASFNAAARKAGAIVLWDLSHSTGAVPLQLARDGSELAVGCGYKYLNGGPGAPAYLYVARHLQARLQVPLSGWFGHRQPFEFARDYVPAPDMRRFLCGTPSVLATVALESGLRCFEGVDMALVRQKSLALSGLFRTLVETRCGEFGLRCVSPTIDSERGSQLSFAHDHAYALMQAIIDRGVIGDFRRPNLVRFGFTPLYTRYVDCWDAVAIMHDLLAQESWRAPQDQQQKTVT